MFDFILEKSGLTIQQFKTQFKEFIVENRLVGTAAGVTIGVTTKDVIQSLVGDIVIPFFYLILFQFTGVEKIELLPGKTTFDFTSFSRQFITWILSVIAIFFFVYYFFMSVIGIKKQKPDNASSSTTLKTTLPANIQPTNVQPTQNTTNNNSIAPNPTQAISPKPTQATDKKWWEITYDNYDSQ